MAAFRVGCTMQDGIAFNTFGARPDRVPNTTAAATAGMRASRRRTGESTGRRAAVMFRAYARYRGRHGDSVSVARADDGDSDLSDTEEVDDPVQGSVGFTPHYVWPGLAGYVPPVDAPFV
eukprot:gene22312-26914_t